MGSPRPLHVDYKNAKIKQYHKLGKAIRTETTINDTRDFGLSKRLTNLPNLRQIGFAANRRLLGVQTISHDPVRGADAFTALTAPIVTGNGTRIPGLRFGDTRVHSLLQALLIHRLLPCGFTNRELRTLIAPLLGKTAGDITAGKMTYDLRRLREHGLIQRIPRTRRYQVTDTGLHQAMLFTHALPARRRPCLPGRFRRPGQASSSRGLTTHHQQQPRRRSGNSTIDSIMTATPPKPSKAAARLLPYLSTTRAASGVTEH